MHAALSELNRKANTFAIQFEYSLQSFTLRGHSAHVLNLFAMQHERVLHHDAFSFSLHPGHFPARYLRHAPQ